MALRKAHTVKWPPRGLTDAINAGSSFPGAMAMLANLIPAQNQKDLWVPRPGSVFLTQLPDYGGGPVTAMITVGNIAYGMYASSQFPGKDRPFAYNMATGAFLPISGLSSGNLPTSQATTGDWTPPTVAQVGSRIIFTHPGFAGGTNTQYPANYPDSFAMFGNISNGSPTITGNCNSNLGVAAGMPPVGSEIITPNVPIGTTVLAASLVFVNTTATGSSGSNTVTVASAAGIQIGQVISAPGASGVVTNIAGTTITLANNNSANLSSAPVQFIGTSITMSANATGTANNQAITFAAFGGAQRFGVLDISGFSTVVLTTTLDGSAIIGAGFNPQTLGIQPGMTLSGTDIPAGATVINCDAFVVTGTATTTAGSSVISTGPGGLSLANFPLAWGYKVAGLGIPSGSFIVNATGPDITNAYSAIQLNQPCTASGTVAITISGGWIQMSANATGTASAPNTVSVTIAGGSQSAPEWSSGDCAINPLAGTPVFVAQFSGRAYYGINTTNPNIGGVTASDSGIASQVSTATQIITFNDGLFVTAGVGLALFNQLGGIIQSLMVFQDDSNIRQITGDFALGNWSQNSLLTATGTSAPNAIASTPRGVLFIAPDGMRLIDFDARVSDPIGADGDGIVLPFTNAVTPSRMQGDYNENIYRLTVTWQPPASVAPVWGTAIRTDEFWFHLPKSISAPIEQGRWSGPHPSTMDQLAPWGTQSSFLIAPSAARGFLYRGDVFPTALSVYTEFGSQMNWTMATPLLPDDEEMMMNAVGRSSILSEVPAATQLLASATDDHGNLLAQGYIWEGPTSVLRHLRIGWDQGFEFRQASFSITGQSAATIQLGTMAHTFQRLGKSQADFPFEFVLGQSNLGGPDVLGP